MSQPIPLDSSSNSKASYGSSFANAQTMIDQALLKLGLSPEKVTDEKGWRHVALGDASGFINVIQWKPGVYYLVVWSPLLMVPNDVLLRGELFEALLQLNHHDTGMARASLEGDRVSLSYVRPIEGLSVNEVVDAIQAVMTTSRDLGKPLRDSFEITMPGIEMNYATWKGVVQLLRQCDGQGRLVFTSLLEGWAKRKGIITAGNNTIGLRARTDPDKSLAGLIGGASVGPIVTVGWDSLEKQWGVQPDDLIKYKDALPRPQRFETTASSAHLPVDDSFTSEMVEQFLDALEFLDQALERAVPPKREPLPDLERRWKLRIEVGGATQRGIHALLSACPPDVQQIFCLLIQSWYDAGQKLYTNKENRLALRLSVKNSTFALCNLVAPKNTKKAQIEFYYPLIYYFEDYAEARVYYEQGIARLPDFVRNRIEMGGAFDVKAAKNLVKCMCRLAADVAQSSSSED